MKVKILFILQSFPSKRSANVLCDEKIIRELLLDGRYEIHCLSSQYEYQNLKEKIGGINICRVKRGKHWNEFTLAKKTDADKRSKFIIKSQRMLMRLAQFFAVPIYPRVQVCLGHKFAKEALKLHYKENFDIVISEYHGEETLYAGYELKKKCPEIKFMPIFWDALAMKQPAKYLPKGFAVKRLQKSEQKVAAVADRIIQMNISEQAYASYLKDNPLQGF